MFGGVGPLLGCYFTSSLALPPLGVWVACALPPPKQPSGHMSAGWRGLQHSFEAALKARNAKQLADLVRRCPPLGPVRGDNGLVAFSQVVPCAVGPSKQDG